MCAWHAKDAMNINERANQKASRGRFDCVLQLSGKTKKIFSAVGTLEKVTAEEKN